jgi:hypothetical protein
MRKAPKRGSSGIAPAGAGLELAFQQEGTIERFKGLGTKQEIIEQINQEWWSVPLAMRVLELGKCSLDYLTNTICIITKENIGGIKMVFRDDVLSFADKTLELVVAEIKGEAISDELAKRPTGPLGLEVLGLTRSQWDFYFRRRLLERGIIALTYTSYGFEAKCPFCIFNPGLKVNLPPTDAKPAIGLWICNGCEHSYRRPYRGNGLTFEILISGKKSRRISNKRLIEARAKVNAIAREAIQQGYKSPDPPINQCSPGSLDDETPVFDENSWTF